MKQKHNKAEAIRIVTLKCAKENILWRIMY